MEDFDATNAGRAIQAFVDEISNWYVRRSRRRFWDGDPAAFATLRACLIETAKLLAPFCPFVADEIYDNLDGSEPSVHLCEFPTPAMDARDPALEDAMAIARETVRLGLAARGQAKLKVRQPLRAAVVVATGEEREAIERMAGSVRDELNVKELRFVSEADELAQVELKPDYRRLGPRFGKQMPLVEAAVAGLDAGARRRHPAQRRQRGDLDQRQGPRADRGGPPGVDEAARGLPARARGLARGRPRARDRRRATRGGLGARDRPGGAAGPPGGRPRGHRPDRAHARRRRGSSSRRHALTSNTSPARRWPSRSATSRSTTTSSPSRSTGASCGSASRSPADRLAPIS